MVNKSQLNKTKAIQSNFRNTALSFNIFNFSSRNLKDGSVSKAKQSTAKHSTYILG